MEPASGVLLKPEINLTSSNVPWNFDVHMAWENESVKDAGLGAGLFPFNLSLPAPASSSQQGALEVFVQNMKVFGMPVLIFGGIIGNGISFLVFVATHLRFQSSSVYLAFLNAIDSLFLFCQFLIWFKQIDNPIINADGVCHCVIYLSYITPFLSVWTVLGFTVERYIVVFHPLRRHSWCTRKRAGTVIVTLTTGALLFYSFALWTHGINRIKMGHKTHYYCGHLLYYNRALNVFRTIDAIITYVLPSVCIITLNIAITIKVWKFVYRRNKQLASQNKATGEKSSHPASHQSNDCRKVLMAYHGRIQQSGEMNSIAEPRESARRNSHASKSRSSESSTPSQPKTVRTGLPSSSGNPRAAMGVLAQANGAKSRVRIQLRTTRTMVIISTVFLVLNLPSHALRVYVQIVYLVDARHILPREVMRWQNLCQLIYYFNFALNLFLYCACSRTFRQGLMRLCRRIKRSLSKRSREKPCSNIMQMIKPSREHADNKDFLRVDEREADSM